MTLMRVQRSVPASAPDEGCNCLCIGREYMAIQATLAAPVRQEIEVILMFLDEQLHCRACQLCDVRLKELRLLWSVHI